MMGDKFDRKFQKQRKANEFYESLRISCGSVSDVTRVGLVVILPSPHKECCSEILECGIQLCQHRLSLEGGVLWLPLDNQVRGWAIESFLWSSRVIFLPFLLMSFCNPWCVMQVNVVLRTFKYVATVLDFSTFHCSLGCCQDKLCIVHPPLKD